MSAHVRGDQRFHQRIAPTGNQRAAQRVEAAEDDQRQRIRAMMIHKMLSTPAPVGQEHTRATVASAPAIRHDSAKQHEAH